MEDYNWPGWPIESNPFGEEFDLAARKRMVEGSKVLQPFIEKYGEKLGKVILEVGPFFNPHVTTENFKDRFIFYWENDRHVLNWLSKKQDKKRGFPIYCDLNEISGRTLLTLKLESEKYFRRCGIDRVAFDSVIMSHLFNYIDYKLFLMVLKDFIKKDTYIFINNVTDYGLPDFFSDKRPRSIPETIKTIKETGYKIIEKKTFDSPYSKHQKNKRLIVVAKNIY